MSAYFGTLKAALSSGNIDHIQFCLDRANTQNVFEVKGSNGGILTKGTTMIVYKSERVPLGEIETRVQSLMGNIQKSLQRLGCTLPENQTR